jgi:hypothetical protein
VVKTIQGKPKSEAKKAPAGQKPPGTF